MSKPTDSEARHLVSLYDERIRLTNLSEVVRAALERFVRESEVLR